jgi:hypothetical protein
VYDCRERQYSLRTFVLLFFSLYVSNEFYVNVPLSFFFIISFVVLITKRINDIPN